MQRSICALACTTKALVCLVALTGCEKTTTARKEPSSPPKTMDRPRFSFSYPAHWVLKEGDPNPEHKVTIQAGTGAMIIVQDFDSETEAAARLPLMVKKQESEPELTKSEFNQWGLFSGVGKELRYKVGIDRSVLRLFTLQKNGKSFFIL